MIAASWDRNSFVEIEVCMKPRVVGYWVTTEIVTAAVLSGGAAQLVHLRANVHGMRTVTIQLYFLTILGAWKVLEAIALLAPGLPRLKEWAYAAIFFEMTGLDMRRSQIALDEGV